MTRLTLPLLLITTLLATLHLFWPVLEWFVLKMSLANGWLHILAFGGLCGLGAYRLYQLPALPLHAPHFSIWPTILWISCGIAYLLNESQVGFNTLSAALFILFAYGLSGHSLRPPLWRSLFVPISLLILVLPFEHYLDIYLGFPLRLLSADWAGSILKHTGLPLLTTESILMIDNRAAIVDLDCSGIKSLWIGLIFYLLLTWIENYRISWRWFAIGMFYVFLLVAANVARITILVLLELVLKLPELAGILHQSLGLVGFGIASATVWWVLQKILRNNQKSHQQPAKLVTGEIPLTIAPDQYLQEARDHGVANPSHAITLSSVILVIIIGMNLLYQPQAITTKATVNQALQLPASYALKESTLNPQETAFFTSNQAQANKYHLTLPIDGKPVRVAMVLVWSRAWKTHHVPENCYLSQGFSIDAQGVWQLPEHTLRYLQLNQPSTDTTGAPKTATYWFQSDNHTTPDYSARVIDNLFHPGRNWVMASILFDQTVTPEQITPFIHTLKQAIGDQFHEAQ